MKVIDDDTDELAILKHLNDIKSAANHTIELHGIVHNSIINLVALRQRIPLSEYFRYHHPPESAASFPEQFLEGIAFLHSYQVAHLDLKPGNVVVDCLGRERKHRPRIIIIDFGLSVFVEDEHTTVEGFCGTPPWVAPEVGTRDGPDKTYSPILADRWACGQMVHHLEMLLAGGGDGSQSQFQEMLKDRLMSADPRARPAVKEVLDAYQATKGGVKRIAEADSEAEAEESDGAIKRARVNLYVCHYPQFSVASNC
jgi:serine/threonine protein kinase